MPKQKLKEEEININLTFKGLPIPPKSVIILLVKQFIQMRLTPIASNMTEVETSDARVLFSYSTPVAAYIYGEGFVKTEKWYSVTTSRHINKWLDGSQAKEVPQEKINLLA